MTRWLPTGTFWTISGRINYYATSHCSRLMLELDLLVSWATFPRLKVFYISSIPRVFRGPRFSLTFYWVLTYIAKMIAQISHRKQVQPNPALQQWGRCLLESTGCQNQSNAFLHWTYTHIKGNETRKWMLYFWLFSYLPLFSQSHLLGSWLQGYEISFLQLVVLLRYSHHLDHLFLQVPMSFQLQEH